MYVYVLVLVVCCLIVGLSLVIIVISLREKLFEFCLDLIIFLGVFVVIFMWMIKKVVLLVMNIDLKV